MSASIWEDRLRGCIGNFSPSKPLYMVVQEMTLAAALTRPSIRPCERFRIGLYRHRDIGTDSPAKDQFNRRISAWEARDLYDQRWTNPEPTCRRWLKRTGWNTEEFLGHCARDKAGIGWEGWKEADLYVYEAIVFGEEKRK